MKSAARKVRFSPTEALMLFAIFSVMLVNMAHQVLRKLVEFKGQEILKFIMPFSLTCMLNMLFAIQIY